MANKTDAIEIYILAKDGNRPFLLDDVFEAEATLKMDVQTEAIAFPSSISGRDAIADTLVRQFNKEYENIYTICIGEPPYIEGGNFNCHWMVVMTEKKSESLRIGCGLYDWNFSSANNRVQSLTITIKIMETETSEMRTEVLTWTSKLPYPWCDLSTVAQDPPNNFAVNSVVQYLHENDDRSL